MHADDRKRLEELAQAMREAQESEESAEAISRQTAAEAREHRMAWLEADFEMAAILDESKKAEG